MIPKVIHYCWFGRNPKPELAEKCILSWKQVCPDYQIVEWNEDNYDISVAPLYVRQAYDAEKWAFVTDYVRLQVIFENGGIYLDTDVELKKSLDELLRYNAYFGFEDGVYINTGLGFGAEKDEQILFELMRDYQNIPFILEDGGFDKTPCPQRNTNAFIKNGLIQNDREQVLKSNIMILPSIVLNPLNYNTGKMRKSRKTISIHWYSASWRTQAEKDWHERHIKAAAERKRDYWIHLPNNVLKKVLGDKKYEQMKYFIKK